MNQDRTYIVCSLELHLFFARVMKEHALFLRAGFTPVDTDLAREAAFFNREFERLLARAVALGDGVVTQRAIACGEFVTDFTALAERQTQRFTGLPIDQALTARTCRLRCGEDCPLRPELCRQVRGLNQRALRLLDGLIALKERVLCRVLDCRMFTMNYPLLIEHITREAKLYRECLCSLEDGGDGKTLAELEKFWNQIMMEHAMFIRGMLDPSENELMDKADCFAKDYAKLLSASCAAQDRASESSLSLTCKLQEFKTAGVQGITGCKIRSIILPLLTDHVLREANHFIRILEN